MDNKADALNDIKDNKSEISKVQLYLEKLDEIKKRCSKSGIEFENKNNDESIYARVSIDAGRSKRLCIIGSLNNAIHFLNINFEDYNFIQGYEAIWCYSTGLIEAAIKPAGFVDPSSALSKLRAEVEGMETDETREIIIAPPLNARNSPRIRIGPPSNEFLVLLRRGIAPRLTFSLLNSQVRRHDDALRELRTYTDSLFFQIDLLYDATFILERERRRWALKKNNTTTNVPTPLAYPRQEYNDSAISLYWYARRARGMPLLQFLAFYQTIEFFFPRYSQIDLRRKLAIILKNPTFRPDRDDDVDRLIFAIRISRSGGLGDERSQLRAVINQCLSAEEIRSFLQEDPDQADHHSAKASKTRYHKVPLANKTADLRNDVADRIYDIRCKIVHTKNDARDGEIETLLPFSDDAEHLMYDIDLVQFVAKSVLISASVPI